MTGFVSFDFLMVFIYLFLLEVMVFILLYSFLVFGRENNPIHLTRCPRVVVISYTMLNRLQRSILGQEWALLIVDESHHVRCTKKSSEPGEVLKNIIFYQFCWF